MGGAGREGLNGSGSKGTGEAGGRNGEGGGVRE